MESRDGENTTKPKRGGPSSIPMGSHHSRSAIWDWSTRDWTIRIPHVFAGCNPFWRATKIGPFFGTTRIEQIKPILSCFLCCSFASALRCREGKYSDDLLTVGEHAIKGQNQIEHRVEVPYKANYEQYVNTEISFEKQVRGVRRALPT